MYFLVKNNVIEKVIAKRPTGDCVMGDTILPQQAWSDNAMLASYDIYPVTVIKPELPAGHKYSAPVDDPVAKTRTYSDAGLADIENLRQQKLNELKVKYEAVFYGGTTSLTKNMGTTPTELFQTIMVGVATSLDPTVYPAGCVNLLTMEGNRVKPNITQFTTYTKDVATHMVQATTRYDVHYDAIEALATAQAIVDYDISTGWPANPVIA